MRKLLSEDIRRERIRHLTGPLSRVKIIYTEEMVEQKRETEKKRYLTKERLKK